MDENVSPPQVVVEIPNTNKKRRIVISSVAGAMIVLSLLTIVLFIYSRNSNTTLLANNSNQKIYTTIPTPTPIPFPELTIPYLRSREYTSNLGERELNYQGSNYSAYVTSYDSDGLRVNGLLTIPSGDLPADGWPAIVFVHGYIPPTEYSTTEKYYDYVDFLARSGFVVFKIDLRGHGSSEGEAGGGYFGSDYIVDTLNARAALQASDFVNPQKVGLWGHSMAGNVTLRSMAAMPDIPATVIWAGAVYSYIDRDKYGIQDSSFSPNQFTAMRQSRRRELFEKVGSPSAQSPYWRMVAPIYFLDDLNGAIEIHHAQDDDVVNIGYSRDLVEILDKTKVPHQFFEYESGGHNISGPSFVTAMQRTVEFYKKYLQ